MENYTPLQNPFVKNPLVEQWEMLQRAREKKKEAQKAAEAKAKEEEKKRQPFNDAIGHIQRDAKQGIRAVPTVEEVLEENEKRISQLRLVGIDQVTGHGVPSHDVVVRIPDYKYPIQYLTEEVANNKLYQDVVEAGSIHAYVKEFNKKNKARLKGGTLSANAVANRLFNLRLKRDPAFAFAMCFTIQDKVSGRNIPFVLNYAQLILLEKLESMRRSGKPIRLVLLKARQWGGSTLVQLYMAWIQLFFKVGWNSVILAQTKDTARRIKGMYTRTLENFNHSHLLFGVPKLKFSPKDGSAADSIVTDEGGKVVRDNTVTIASFENFEATRGANFAMAHYSEVAYWVNTPGKSAEALITNIAGGMLMLPLTLEVLESTANGMSGYFYDEYTIAKDPKAHSIRECLFIPFFFILNDTLPFDSEEDKTNFAKELIANRLKTEESPTTESGEYLYSLWCKGASLESINWYIKKRASFHDHASMASEAPSDDIECFKHSGRTIFDQYLVDKYIKEYAREPIFKGEIVKLEGQSPQLVNKSEEAPLWIWQYADATETIDRYLVVVDVGGRSTKADFSVITVVDRWALTMGGKAEVVARWRGHIRYDQLAYKAVLIARMYCNALLVFESNTFDKKKAESTEFVESGDHTRGILATIEDTYENLYMRRSTNPEDIRQGRYKKVGFQTNVKTKQDIVDFFTVAFEDNSNFIERDIRAFQEMAIYEQREDGTYGNISGRNNHDDILMTDMIAAFISEQMPLPSLPKHESPEDWDWGTINESLF